MLDTLKLYDEHVATEALKQHEDWRTEVTSDGEAVKQHATVFLNAVKDAKDKLLYNGTIRLEYSHQKKYFAVSLSSAPALLYGTSFKTVQRSDLSRLQDALQQQVCKFADIDINTSLITRLDNSVVYSMNALSSKYINLLDELTRNRQQHAQKKYFENETIEFYNRLRTIGFYDKHAKNSKNALESTYIQDNYVQSNELRYEIQNKKSRSIKHAFKLTDGLTLKQLDTDYIEEALYKQRIKEFNKHFKFTIGEHKITLEDFFNTSVFMKTAHKRTALDKTLWLIALKKNFISLSEVRAIMHASGYSKQAVYRRMKSFKELLEHDIDKTELYDELKAKIEAA
jgi:hypothetical protein